MDRKIVIRHQGGRAGQTEEFPINGSSEVLVGRDPECKLRFDEKSDTVSRRHARLSAAGGDNGDVSITDLGSSNGTFVNKQRIFSQVKLSPGDVVQLGPGGPEFQFDLDPRPATKATRMADLPGSSTSAATREVSPPAPTRESTATAAAAATAPTMVAKLPTQPTQPAQTVPGAFTPTPTPSGSTTVGKATVERMIGQQKAQSRTQMVVMSLVLLAVIGGVTAYLLTRPKPAPVTVLKPTSDCPGCMNPAAIASQYSPAVVFIQVAWNLVDANNGRTVNQVYIPNAYKDANGKDALHVEGAGPTLPVFVIDKNNKIVPLLTTDDGGGAYVPIGEIGDGSGFLVTSDGFILTNRHVAEGWRTSYDGWALHEDAAGMVLVQAADGSGELKAIAASQFPTDWVPEKATALIEGKVGQANPTEVLHSVGFESSIQGHNSALDVTLANNTIRNAATVSSASDAADVAMIKISMPAPLTHVDLNDNYDTIQPGATVTVMGYPGIAPNIISLVQSTDPFASGSVAQVKPTPTVSSGNVGRVVRNGPNNNLSQLTLSTMGDYYQLAINTTGSGNSGGPVFDDHGRVIGLFTATRQEGGTSITFAVPIRYGMQLMGTSK